MSVSAKLGTQLPLLRRYARALTGSQSSGDAFVRATLEAALADPDLLAEISKGRVWLYAAFTRVWSSSHVETEPVGGSGSHEQAVQERLSRILPVHRQALLLTALEEFSVEETATILDLPSEDVERLVYRAIADIEQETATDVLIIEDEPLIAMQLEGLVTDMGHRVVAIATTRQRAQEAFAEKQPGLVLADIQLADGSSGIDAAEDILQFGDLPIIFITAYPEKLLTGERPEPTYLVTKPFRDETVRTAISQALFFGSSQPIE